jgi:hypothetical protein
LPLAHQKIGLAEFVRGGGWFDRMLAAAQNSTS